MARSHELGKRGELIAKKYLERCDYEICCTNYRCRSGEIDIVCKGRGVLVFVEVKTRSSNKYGNTADIITNFKKFKVLTVAHHYCSENGIDNECVRMDAIEIIYKRGERGFFLKHYMDIVE